MGSGGGASLKAKIDIKPLSVFSSGKNEKRTIKEIIITDVSRMDKGNLCIFGIDAESNHIRPIIPVKGLNKENLNDKNGNRVIRPFSIIKFDFIRPYPELPHSEDYIINPCFKPVLKRELDEHEVEFLLNNILDSDVESIFGTEIIKSQYTNRNHGSRSIGTILVDEVYEISYVNNNSKPRFKIWFSDSAGNEYQRPITDCAFQNYYLNCLERDVKPFTLNEKLKLFFNQNKLYLRVGLGRHFNGGHWLIVTGLYSFPDYKKGEW